MEHIERKKLVQPSACVCVMGLSHSSFLSLFYHLKNKETKKGVTNKTKKQRNPSHKQAEESLGIFYVYLFDREI